MKLAKGFVTHNINKTQVMVAAGEAAKTFNGMVRSNETAAFIIDCLKEETSIEDIVKKLTDIYEVDANTARKDVNDIIEKLSQIGAIGQCGQLPVNLITRVSSRILT